MAEKKAERFWAYALEVYGQDAAREALLRLQDQNGADVPLVLWCLWCGIEGGNVSEDVMKQAVDFSVAWREQTVMPLRMLRKSLKPGISGVSMALSEAARVKVAETEQATERLQMNHLAALPLDAVQDNAPEILDRYALIAGLRLDAVDVAILLKKS